MSETKKVTFHATTKQHNYGKIKMHTKKTNHIDYQVIEIIMFQTNSTREVAVEVYNKFDGDLVDSLMYIDEQKMGI